MIHVCFVLHDKTGSYSKFTGTAICSLFENTSSSPRSITIHILHDKTLTNDNRDKFSYLAGHYHQIVKFYNVEELCPEKIKVIKKMLREFSKKPHLVVVMYRFLIPHLFSKEIDKIIYLDSNIIINLDINKFWLIKLDNKPLGAIPNSIQSQNKQEMMQIKKLVKIYGDDVINAEDYFNSGVLLLNLKVLVKEEDKIISAIKFIAEHHQYENLDQDVLNYCFSKKYLHLPIEFNRMVKDLRRNKDFAFKREIYHYTDGYVGLGLDFKDLFNRLWMDYFAKTPWFDGSVIGNLYKSMEEFSQDRKNTLIKFSATLSGKIRAFIVKEEDISWAKEKFFIQDDEDIIVVDTKDKDALNKLIELMNIDHDKKIFFVMIPNFTSVLEKAGFVHKKDFFSYHGFFLPNLFSKKDIYSLILAM